MSAAAEIERQEVEDSLVPPDEAALRFLDEHTHMKSSRILGELAEVLQFAAEDNIFDFFLAAVERRLLSFEKALLWQAFVLRLPSLQKTPGREKLQAAGLSVLFETYDRAVDEALAIHWAPAFDEDEEDDA